MCIVPTFSCSTPHLLLVISCILPSFGVQWCECEAARLTKLDNSQLHESRWVQSELITAEGTGGAYRLFTLHSGCKRATERQAEWWELLILFTVLA